LRRRRKNDTSTDYEIRSLGGQLPEDIRTREIEARIVAEGESREKLENELQELKASMEKRQSSPKQMQRRKIDPRKTFIAMLKHKNQEISQRNICTKMDDAMDKNPILAPLKSWGKPHWAEAYLDPTTKSRVQIYLSKIKPRTSL
jgi:hypothetical protein